MKARSHEGTNGQQSLASPAARPRGADPAHAGNFEAQAELLASMSSPCPPSRLASWLPVLRACYFVLATACFWPLLSGALSPPQGPRLSSFASEHYIIHTDMDDALAREMMRELELCYGEFSRRLSMFEGLGRPGSEDPFNVYLFSRHTDYISFTGGEFPNTGGLFVSRKRALAVYLEDQGREQLRKTLRHEAFHQFAYEKIGPGLPVWINEGLAQLFEEGIRVDEGLRIGMVPPDRLRQLQHDISSGRLIDFETILKLNDDAWSRTLADRGRAATQYTQAWAMVHFLIFAQDASGNAIYRERFNSMLRDIADGRTGWGSFTRHFGLNVEGFRARFVQYIQALAPTPESKTLEDQRVLAELLVLLKQRGQEFATVDSFRRHVIERRYRLESRRDEVTWSTDADVGVYFRDAQGRLLDARQLRFQPDPFGELPALVRQPGDGLIYRTRFYELEGKLMHETLCEPEPTYTEVTVVR
jgi:hypothetical protein